jgi:hypothetical protein
MIYDQEIFWCILFMEIVSYLWDYAIAYEYFMAKADFIHMLFPNVYDYFISAQR